MSYDLAVFDPDVAPRSRVEFRRWFDEQTQWEESHGHGDMIYGAFAGSVGAAAYRRAFELAQKHRVGFYNLSDVPSDIWIPGPSGNFTKVV